MKEIISDKTLVSKCGLYCGSCSKYLKDKCPGCDGYEKATWCKVRTCCMEHGYASCADCNEFENAMECKKFNSFFSRMIGFILRSDREAGIKMIKEKGYEGFAAYMAENRLVTIRP
jgi:hypothetical protein